MRASGPEGDRNDTGVAALPRTRQCGSSPGERLANATQYATSWSMSRDLSNTRSAPLAMQRARISSVA